MKIPPGIVGVSEVAGEEGKERVRVVLWFGQTWGLTGFYFFGWTGLVCNWAWGSFGGFSFRFYLILVRFGFMEITRIKNGI